MVGQTQVPSAPRSPEEGGRAVRLPPPRAPCVHFLTSCPASPPQTAARSQGRQLRKGPVQPPEPRQPRTALTRGEGQDGASAVAPVQQRAWERVRQAGLLRLEGRPGGPGAHAQRTGLSRPGGARTSPPFRLAAGEALEADCAQQGRAGEGLTCCGSGKSLPCFRTKCPSSFGGRARRGAPSAGCPARPRSPARRGGVGTWPPPRAPREPRGGAGKSWVLESESVGIYSLAIAGTTTRQQVATNVREGRTAPSGWRVPSCYLRIHETCTQGRNFGCAPR